MNRKEIERKIEKEKIEKQFEEFLLYMKSEKDASDATLTSYTTDFNIFVDFLKQKGFPLNMNQVDTAEMRQYVVFLRTKKKYANNTVRRKIHSLKSFSKFLVSQDYITKDPMRAISAPKRTQTLPKVFTKSELELLFKTAKNSTHDFALRDYIFIRLLAKTGMRKSEAINLNFNDINFGENTIRVKGKGKKERIIPIDQEFSSELFMYFQSRLPLKNPAVFINSVNNRIAKSKAQIIFTHLLEKCGLENTGLTIHSLRHTYATALISSGVDIAQVQKLLGHTDINTTTIYTHISVENLREDVAKLPY